MRFSYFVNQQPLLQSINLSLQAGKIILITGEENYSTLILSGILGNMLPVNAHIDIPEIKSLMENYTGSLHREEGRLYDNIAYISADPDHHLLFSTVKEELSVQIKNNQLLEKIVSFGLDASFLERRINQLSGGEKMKVALTIAFAQQSVCYVLHGIIPWLDQQGRELLFTQVTKLKNQNTCIVFIEQELEVLLPYVDTILEFNNSTLHAREKNLFSLQYQQNWLKKSFCLFPLKNNHSREPLIEFHNVELTTHPFSENNQKQKLLDQITLTLLKRKIYCLTGENGAGKSTLVQMIFRLFNPTQGAIFLEGKPLKSYQRNELNELICYVSQFPAQQLTSSMIGQYRLQAKQKKHQLTLTLMNKYLNLEDNFPIALLSVLQIKLLCFLNALSEKTQLIILDEPTWGIDQIGTQIIINLLNDVAQALDFTLLIISHDLRFAHALNAEIIQLCHGKLITQ